MRIISFLILSFLGLSSFAQEGLQSPEQFLPTAYGQEFTPHHLVVDYFKYVAKNSASVQFEQFGRSIEKRPLCIVVISSPENIKNIESIRQNNLKLTGLIPGKANRKTAKSIIWVDFGVHGNEAGATESSMRLLFQLAQKNADWFKDIVVVFNPSLNPDGLDRYVSWNRSVSNKVLMPNQLSREHQEDWPGGRGNHYHFDLNRDWSWGTQPETKALLRIYHKWMPHIVLDLHEQQPERHYYFAPAAEPIHDYISEFQREFQGKIGQHNAEIFDAKKWLYFTGETFDLFYPGYGDTYPSFNGAVGMTFEQAGHGVAGKGINLENGKVLSIAERIEHHIFAVIATIETASLYRKDIIKAFGAYFEKSQKQLISSYQGFVIKKGRSAYRLNKLVDLLDLHQIQYHSVSFSRDVVGYDYQKQEKVSFVINPGDLVIPSKQPMSVLANVLLEPKSHLADSMTYDITTWSLPYVFNLEGYAVGGVLPELSLFPERESIGGVKGVGDYAWVIPWKDLSSAQLLSQLMLAEIQVRYAMEPFTLSGKDFERGSLVVTRSDNEGKKLPEILERLSTEIEIPIFALESGTAQKGFDLGSTSFKLIQHPKIALVAGSFVNAYNYGEVWQFLDMELQLPFVSLSNEKLQQNKIWDFNTIILADGDYNKLTSKTKNYIKSWMSKGGNLILIGDACKIAISAFDLVPKENEAVVEDFVPYGKKGREELSNMVPGAIVEVWMDKTHSLAFGYEDVYYSMKVKELSYALLHEGHTVGRTSHEVQTIGYFGKDFKAHLGDNMIFGVQEIGEGQVVFLVDNPLFRSFWEGGKLLMANALFFRM